MKWWMDELTITGKDCINLQNKNSKQ